jgi:hypothetical protein
MFLKYSVLYFMMICLCFHLSAMGRCPCVLPVPASMWSEILSSHKSSHFYLCHK